MARLVAYLDDIGEDTVTVRTTLQFVFEDYIHHMKDHLQHMKVQVDDLK